MQYSAAWWLGGSWIFGRGFLENNFWRDTKNLGNWSESVHGEIFSDYLLWSPWSHIWSSTVSTSHILARLFYIVSCTISEPFERDSMMKPHVKKPWRRYTNTLMSLCHWHASNTSWHALLNSLLLHYFDFILIVFDSFWFLSLYYFEMI